MDGASQLTIFSRIVLPISLPVLATIGLFSLLRILERLVVHAVH